MTDEILLYHAAEDVARITLNRPDKLNALTRPLLVALAEALGRAADDRAVRAVILTGAGRAFCAGQDLGEAAVIGEDAGAEVAQSLDQFYHPVLKRLQALPVPVIAAVNGIAAGAGANLALNCDIVLAARSATFVQAFTRIALVPDCGGTWLLPRLVGLARAKQLMLLAEPLSAEDAANWGLIAQAIHDETFEPEVEALAARLAQGPTLAYGALKEALAASTTNDFAAQLDLERDLQAKAASSADFREGVAAFAEKRAARFEGK
ncbi:MAG: enoyl-CoA hydratase-related protein [Pseudomonadota bacterium]